MKDDLDDLASCSNQNNQIWILEYKKANQTVND
jgi:hypothetical protein